MASNRIRALIVLDGYLQRSLLEPQCCRSTFLFSPLGSLIGILHSRIQFYFFFGIQNLFNNRVESGVSSCSHGWPLVCSNFQPLECTKGLVWLCRVPGALPKCLYTSRPLRGPREGEGGVAQAVQAGVWGEGCP